MWESIFGIIIFRNSSFEIPDELENKSETNRTETIPQLLNDYEDFLDWVFFYLSYDNYKCLEQAKDNVNSFEQSIKECHDSFIQIEISIKSLTEVLENQKKKFTAELDEERAKLMEDITKLKVEVDEDREEIKNKIYGDDSTKFFGWNCQKEWMGITMPGKRWKSRTMFEWFSSNDQIFCLY